MPEIQGNRRKALTWPGLPHGPLLSARASPGRWQIWCAMTTANTPFVVLAPMFQKLAPRPRPDSSITRKAIPMIVGWQGQFISAQLLVPMTVTAQGGIS